MVLQVGGNRSDEEDCTRILKNEMFGFPDLKTRLPKTRPALEKYFIFLLEFPESFDIIPKQTLNKDGNGDFRRVRFAGCGLTKILAARPLPKSPSTIFAG